MFAIASRARRPALLALVAALSGCGGDGPGPAVTAPQGATTGPHGGVALPLPGEKGYAEVVVEREAGKGRAGTAKAPVRLAVYFLDAERKAALSPLPADVSIKAMLPTGDSPTVALKAEPKSGDPAGGGRFASTPGDYNYDELSGEVSTTVDGQSVTLPFAFR